MPNHNIPANAFKAGNQLYKCAAYTGRPKLFATPDALLNAACDYFDWVEHNPVIAQVFRGGEYYPVRKMRAMSLQGLSVHAGVCNLRRYNKHPDFAHVIDYIKTFIFAHNFAGVAAGLLKPNIIARSLGL